MPFVLHAFLVAAIFTAYMTLMLTLGAYIYRTGHQRADDHPRSDDPPDTGDEEPELLPIAA